MDYDELVQKNIAGEISDLEFLLAQEELAPVSYTHLHRDQLLLDALGRAHVLYRAGEGIGGKSRRRDA